MAGGRRLFWFGLVALAGWAALRGGEPETASPPRTPTARGTDVDEEALTRGPAGTHHSATQAT